MIIIKNFSSTLTSLLAVKVSPIRFRFFQEVIDDSSYKLVLEAETALTTDLKVNHSASLTESSNPCVGWKTTSNPFPA